MPGGVPTDERHVRARVSHREREEHVYGTPQHVAAVLSRIIEGMERWPVLTVRIQRTA